MHRYTSHSFALSVPYFLLGLAVKGVDKCGANVYKNKVFGMGGALFIDRLIQVCFPQMDTGFISTDGHRFVFHRWTQILFTQVICVNLWINLCESVD